MGRRSIVYAVVLGSLTLSAIADSVPAGQPMRAIVDANRVLVKAGDVEVAEYRYGDVPFKPYVKRLFTSNGLNVLLDAPHDHLHHHALMFAVGADAVNFWEETPAAGRQKHVSFAELADEPPHVGFMERLDWLDPSGERLLAEQRAIVVSRPVAPRMTMLTWESRLSVPTGKGSVTLTGAHYFGLGMRFIRAMDAKGQFRNADDKPGVVFRGEERLVRSNWCAYTAGVDGDDVTVAMFGHPSNPRHPTTWFTMTEPFAYLSATLGLHEEPFKLVEGNRLDLRYAVVLWDRRAQTDEIDETYRKWASMSAIASNP